MDFTEKDLLNMASRDFILGNTTPDEIKEFIIEQIQKPFDSGSANYFKQLRKVVSNKETLSEICSEAFTEIENVYPNLSFDYSEYTGTLPDLFANVYKFFVKNIQKLMQAFLREYIFNNKNRKGLVEEHMPSKLSSYPKEQYGKKEYYVLITKLPGIVQSIREDGVSLDKFMDYVERSKDSTPMYFDSIRDCLSRGIIIDDGIVDSIFECFFDSDAYNGIMNKLEMDITSRLIMPYLEETGMASRVIVPDDPDDDDTDDDDDEEEDNDELS